MSDLTIKKNVVEEVHPIDLEGLSDSNSSVVDDEYIDHLGYESTLSKKLKSRHIGMISLVGVFGTGLFLSSGSVLANAGPVGMLIGFVFVGIVVGANQICITETSCLMPVTSGQIRHSEHFIDDSFAFAIGWINVYAAIIPTELAATAVVMKFWTDLSPAIWITIFGLVVVAVNCYNIKWYGEIEFVFGLLKIALILILIITGLVIDLGGVPGQDRIGFRYWKNPGPFAEKYTTGNLGKFAGFWKAVSSIVYSYGGVQGISFLSGETEHPRRAIYRAAKRVFARVFTLYLLTVFVLTLIVPSNNKAIAAPNGTAAASPFVIAMQGRVKVLPHFINAVVCSSALSAENIGVIHSSRTFFALAAKKQAPKIFLRTNKHGLPWVGVLVGCLFLPLAYMSVNKASNNVFSWFQNVTSSNLLMNWITISLNHIRMDRAIKRQGYSRRDLPYRIPGAPFAAWFSLFFSALFLLTGGFSNFIKGHFDFGSFFGSYFVIPLFIVLFIGHKIFTRKIKRSADVDLRNLFKHVELNPEPPYPKKKGWEWLTLLWA